MTVPSKVIVLDPDARSGRQLRLGFEREGVPTGAMDPEKPEITEAPDLVIVGGADGQGIELVRKVRALLDIGGYDAPIVFAGSHARPTEVEAAGADEVVLRPAFLRDVVTIGRILRGKPAENRAHIVGSLAETTGVFNLVRALSALGRSAVLTLIRGLRRGEVRFYHGEVTSAQVGLIHGQAALHQLLLWTDARFDFHHEDVVRRQQIPLAPEELFADAERFLAGVRDESGRLSPSMVLEQDIARIHSLGKQIPTEVHGVLRMFDGHRVLADILEDSPYRVFETLRVTQRAVEAGLLRPTETKRARASWRAVLAIEEWLVGSETRDAVVERTAAIEAEAKDKEPPKQKSSRRTRKKKRMNTPISLQPPKMDIDWGALVPRVVGAEVGPLAGVVPAAQASGEIASRDAPRERLEALMDTQAREKMFSAEVSAEPKIIFDEAEERRLGAEQTRAKAAAKADTERLAAEQAAAEKVAAEQAAAEKLAAEKAAADKAAAEKLVAEKAAADKAAAEKLAAEKLVAETLAAEKLAADMAAAEKAAADMAAAEKLAAEKLAAEKLVAEKLAAEKAAADKAAADMAAAEKLAADMAAADKAAADMAAALAMERAAADKLAGEKLIAAERAAAEKAAAETEAAEKAAARAKLEAEEDARAKAEAKERRGRAEARARSEAEKEDAANATKLEAEARVRAEAEARARAAEADRRAAEAALAKAEALATAAEEETERLRREARQRQDAGDRARVDAETWSTAFAKAEAALDDSAHVAAVMAIGDSVTTTPFVRPEPTEIHTPAVTVAETPAVKVTVHDTMSVKHGADVAHVTATPIATVTERSGAAGAPETIDDEPSDGVVRQLATAETAPVRRAPPGQIPEDDRPKDTEGEIGARTAHEPSVDVGPSILIDDLAAAQAAISSVITQAARTKDAATPEAAKVVAEVRKDATSFSADEQAFFKQHETGAVPRQSLEEIDHDPYEKPAGFWDRLLKRKPPKK